MSVCMYCTTCATGSAAAIVTLVQQNAATFRAAKRKHPMTLAMRVQVFGNGDSYNSLLWTTFFVSLLSWGLYRMQYFEGDKHMWFFNKSKKAQPILRFKRAQTSFQEIMGLLWCKCVPLFK